MDNSQWGISRIFQAKDHSQDGESELSTEEKKGYLHYPPLYYDKGMEQTYTGRCMRCRVNDREMIDVEVVTIKGKGGSERRAAKGKCKVCGCSMYKMLPKAA